MNTPSHENWQDERQRERRSIIGALRAAEDEEKTTDDQDRKDEDFLDQERGVWGPTE